MVDKTLILRKLAELEGYLAQIKEYQEITVEQYSRDWKIQRIIERTLQMMIETCVDIAGHIISDSGYRAPKSYSDTFKVLNEAGVLNEMHFERMSNMAKFRNVVVHHYDRVDSEIVVHILKNNLNDFSDFKDTIINELKSIEQDNPTNPSNPKKLFA